MLNTSRFDAFGEGLSNTTDAKCARKPTKLQKKFFPSKIYRQLNMNKKQNYKSPKQMFPRCVLAHSLYHSVCARRRCGISAAAGELAIDMNRLFSDVASRSTFAKRHERSLKMYKTTLNIKYFAL